MFCFHVGIYMYFDLVFFRVYVTNTEEEEEKKEHITLKWKKGETKAWFLFGGICVVAKF